MVYANTMEMDKLISSTTIGEVKEFRMEEANPSKLKKLTF
jgi:hypothetical protein